MSKRARRGLARAKELSSDSAILANVQGIVGALADKHEDLVELRVLLGFFPATLTRMEAAGKQALQDTKTAAKKKTPKAPKPAASPNPEQPTLGDA